MSMDDSSEFMELAQAVMSDMEASEPDQPRMPRGSRSKEKTGEGHLTQYATGNGVHFMPTSSTAKTLPPDCYSINISMEGNVIFARQNVITDDLLRLPDSRSDEVVAEVERFWTLKTKFKEYGFAHKRGFLLFGPPGSGKTSTIAIITTDMVKRGGLVIFCENPMVLAKGLGQLRIIEPDRPVAVVMEDIDTIIRNYGESTVLSVLDGESQIENVVYIATTNYPENLDGRITNRPSRFDRIVKIGFPNEEARRMYLKSKVNNLEIEGLDIVKETEGFSIAHIKELIVGHWCQGNPIRDVLDRLKKMKSLPTSSSDNRKIGFGG